MTAEAPSVLGSVLDVGKVLWDMLPSDVNWAGRRSTSQPTCGGWVSPLPT